MTNTVALENLILHSKYSKKEIAKALHLSRFTLSQKLRNKQEFCYKEIQILSDLLHIEDISGIFFVTAVEKKSTFTGCRRGATTILIEILNHGNLNNN